jgi:hypothetical protein
MMVLCKYSGYGILRSLALYVTSLLTSVTALSVIAAMGSLSVVW